MMLNYYYFRIQTPEKHKNRREETIQRSEQKPKLPNRSSFVRMWIAKYFQSFSYMIVSLHPNHVPCWSIVHIGKYATLFLEMPEFLAQTFYTFNICHWF
jgi:hypothetical protein